ncbi:rhodanese-related sulfurtransferase [Candidatus Woesearchaeota archaeon]|nr:rhodanese-related sulfurtransferase [Candidatus Woesearchaeota archaeon]
MVYKVISFYKYIEIENPEILRDEMRKRCNELNILGRILIGNEGINACVSGKIKNIDDFKKVIMINDKFKNLTFREEEIDNFKHHKLVVRVRKEIVHFGHKVDMNKKGKHIKPEELKNLLDKNENIILIDARNNYETAVGKFKDAITLPIETFREFPLAIKKFEDLKDKKIVTYCTGGIRCEKASAYLVNQGFENVYQLEEGIINYINKFPNDYFEGSCFVFDDRLISRNGNMIISKCELCNKESDEYINCHNIDCNKLFISYKDCQEKLNKHCSEKCEKVKRHRPETGKWYDALGIVKNYYRKTKIVETRLNKGIKLNEKIKFIDKNNNETEQEIIELRNFHGENIESANPGEIITFPVSQDVRKNDRIVLYG